MATTHTEGVLQISSLSTSVVVVDVHTAKLGNISETAKQNRQNMLQSIKQTSKSAYCDKKRKTKND